MPPEDAAPTKTADPPRERAEAPPGPSDAPTHAQASPGGAKAAPRAAQSASAPAPFVRIENLALTRSAHEIGIRFDCATNLAEFRRPRQRNVQRSYEELALYASAISLLGPSLIVPVLPLPTASMLSMPATAEEGDGAYELHELHVQLEHWFDRVMSEPQLRTHRETRRFIEADFRYEPEEPSPDAPTGMRSAFTAAIGQVRGLAHVLAGEHLHDASSPSRPGRMASLLGLRPQAKRTPAGLTPVQMATGSLAGIVDPDEQLVLARSEVTRLEKQLGQVASACERVVSTRRSLDRALETVATRIAPIATLEESRAVAIHGRLPRTLRAAHSTLMNTAHVSDSQAAVDQVTLADAFEYQALNMRAARQVLQERNAVVAEHSLAQHVAQNKRADAESMRMSRTLHPDRVDAAVEEVREAEQHEQLLAHYLAKVSNSLRGSLQRHSRYAHQDLLQICTDHGRTSLVTERRMRDALALYKADSSAAAAEAQEAMQKLANPKRKQTPAQTAAARAAGKEPKPEPGPEPGPESEAPKAESAATQNVAGAPAAPDTQPAGDAKDTQPEPEQAAPAPEPPVARSADRDEACETPAPQAERTPTPPRSPTPPPPPPAEPSPWATVASTPPDETPSPPEPSPPPEAPAVSARPGGLFGARERGPWTRLSASDAARTLGGTF